MQTGNDSKIVGITKKAKNKKYEDDREYQFDHRGGLRTDAVLFKGGREMSEKIIETKVALAGTRESIIRILNQAFRMCSNKEFKIADGDILEAINRKIDAANKNMAGYQTGFTLMDYLDDRARMDSPIK